MLERHLTHEFRRAVDARPVPEDLFPTGLVAEARRASRRGARRRLAGVLAAASVAVVVLATPLAQGIGAAVTRIVTDFRVARVDRLPVPCTSDLDPLVNPDRYRPGDVVEIPYQACPDGQTFIARSVARVLTVADLAGLPEPFPVPAYRGPAAGDRVVIAEAYEDVGDLDRLTAVVMNVKYVTPDGARIHLTLRRNAGASDLTLEAVRDPRHPAVLVDDPEARVVRVTFRGQPATAWYSEGRWHLAWWYAGGSGTLRGRNISLEELIRIGESMPDVR